MTRLFCSLHGENVPVVIDAIGGLCCKQCDDACFGHTSRAIESEILLQAILKVRDHYLISEQYGKSPVFDQYLDNLDAILKRLDNNTSS